MQYKVQHNSDFYECTHSWIDDCSIQISEPDIACVKNGKIIQKHSDGDNKYLFSVLHPVTDNIEMPEAFLFGKWQRHMMWLTGSGKTIEASEKSAALRLSKVSSCSHNFIKVDDDLFGDARCSHCGVFIQEYFLHRDIHYSKYKAFEFHGEQKFSGDITIKSHLFSTTQEMAYDYHLDEVHKIDLMCAGWLHHTNGQISSSDIVEKTIKYFYLDPKEMHESLLLTYYDLTDTMKILMQSKNIDLLKETLQKSLEILPFFESKDMPHANFIKMYNSMAQQSILFDSHLVV